MTNVISLKKQEALALIYSGKSKTFVRKKLNVKVKRLDSWLGEDLNLDPDELIKKKALHMYFYKISKKKICKRLLVKHYQLDNWIKTAFKINSREVKSVDYLRKDIEKQPGRTQFITNVCKKNKTLH